MNILIIGSSNAIKKLFQDKFLGNNINIFLLGVMGL